MSNMIKQQKKKFVPVRTFKANKIPQIDVLQVAEHPFFTFTQFTEYTPPIRNLRDGDFVNVWMTHDKVFLYRAEKRRKRHEYITRLSTSDGKETYMEKVNTPSHWLVSVYVFNKSDVLYAEQKKATFLVVLR